MKTKIGTLVVAGAGSGMHFLHGLYGGDETTSEQNPDSNEYVSRAMLYHKSGKSWLSGGYTSFECEDQKQMYSDFERAWDGNYYPCAISHFPPHKSYNHFDISIDKIVWIFDKDFHWFVRTLKEIKWLKNTNWLADNGVRIIDLMKYYEKFGVTHEMVQKQNARLRKEMDYIYLEHPSVVQGSGEALILPLIMLAHNFELSYEEAKSKLIDLVLMKGEEDPTLEEAYDFLKDKYEIERYTYSDFFFSLDCPEEFEDEVREYSINNIKIMLDFFDDIPKYQKQIDQLKQIHQFLV